MDILNKELETLNQNIQLLEILVYELTAVTFNINNYNSTALLFDIDKKTSDRFYLLRSRKNLNEIQQELQDREIAKTNLLNLILISNSANSVTR